MPIYDVKMIDSQFNQLLAAINAVGTNVAGAVSGAGGSGGGSAQTDEEKKLARQKKNITSLSNVINGLIDSIYATMTNNIKKQQKIYETNAKIFQNNLRLQSDALAKSTGELVSMINTPALKVAFTGLKNTLDIGTKSIKTSLENYNALLDRTLELKRIETDTTKTWLGFGGQLAGAIGGSVKSLAGTIIQAAAGSITRGITRQLELDFTKYQFFSDIEKKKNELQSAMLDAAQNAMSEWVVLAESASELITKINEKGVLLGREFGLNVNDVALFARGLVDTNLKMSELGKTYEDFVKIQQSYVNSTGRNIMLTDDEGQQIAAMSMAYGISVDEAANVVGSMNVFNTSVSEGVNMMDEMYKTANRMGISNQKFVKDLANNLKLADKYQFKGGSKGLMEMALWAQKTRLSMNAIASSMAKISTGNIEDVITMAAQLNVLGGQAALYSNPLGMLFDRYTDPQAYGMRISESLRGLGRFDKELGETVFSMHDQLLVEQISKAWGITTEEAISKVRQADREEAIRERYGDVFGKQADLVYQNATYRDGQWRMNIMDSSGTKVEKTLEEIRDNRELLNHIWPNDKQEVLIEYSKRTMSATEAMAAAMGERSASIAKGAYDYVLGDLNEIIGSQKRELSNHLEKYVGYVKGSADAALAHQKVLETKQIPAVEEFTSYLNLMNKAAEKAVNPDGGGIFQDFLNIVKECNGNLEVFSALMNDYTEKKIKEAMYQPLSTYGIHKTGKTENGNEEVYTYDRDLVKSSNVNFLGKDKNSKIIRTKIANYLQVPESRIKNDLKSGEIFIHEGADGGYTIYRRLPDGTALVEGELSKEDMDNLSGDKSYWVQRSTYTDDIIVNSLNEKQKRSESEAYTGNAPVRPTQNRSSIAVTPTSDLSIRWGETYNNPDLVKTVKIDGKLMLEGPQGQVVDLIAAIRANPWLARELYEMVMLEGNAARNGGRATYQRS